MKTEEDEAFDDLAKKQGDWGSGFKAKQAMAADKLQEPPSEWEGIKAILDEYGLQAIDFVADFKEALAQPAQEPVAWMSEENDCIFFGADKPNPMDYDFWTPLYTTSPQREWVGLTDEETSGFTQHEMTVVKYVSKVLQEKNT